MKVEITIRRDDGKVIYAVTHDATRHFRWYPNGPNCAPAENGVVLDGFTYTPHTRPLPPACLEPDYSNVLKGVRFMYGEREQEEVQPDHVRDS